MFWKNETLPDLAELAETYQRKKRQLADLQKELKEIEQLVESTGRLQFGEPAADDKWELPPFKVCFYSLVDVDQPQAEAFLRLNPEYWRCFQMKISALKPKLLKAYAGAPSDVRMKLNKVFELKAAKPRFTVKEEKDL